MRINGAPPSPPSLTPVPPAGAVLVTDAIAAMGLPGRKFSLGQGEVEVVGGAARLAGTDTLAGRYCHEDTLETLSLSPPLSPQCGHHGPVYPSLP